MRRITLDISVDGNGDGETTAESVIGLLYAIQPVLGNLDTGLTLTLTFIQNSVDVPVFAQTTFDENLVYPRTLEADSTGTPTTTYAMPLIAGNLHAVVAGGGDTVSGKFILYILDSPAVVMKVVNEIADSTRPTEVISSTEDDPTTASPIPVVITFSEAVAGFTVDDLVIDNGSADNFVNTNNLIYTADVTPTIPGAVTVDIAADVCTDLSGNGNFAAIQFSIIYSAL